MTVPGDVMWDCVGPSSSLEGVVERDSPKSRILRTPSRVRKRFSGLMSRWTIPFPCAAASPWVIWMASPTASLGVMAPAPSRSLSVIPSRSSVTA